MRINRGSVAIAALFCVLACVRSGFAQEEQPIGRVVADVRGVFDRKTFDPSISNDLGVVPGNLPSHSFGVAVGAHRYVWHGRKFTLGVGSHAVFAKGSRALDLTSGGNSTSSTPAPVVDRHFLALVPEVSLNFGHRTGWSYVSGGAYGISKLYLDRPDVQRAAGTWRPTIHYGAGARWFVTHTIAFCIDLRWYAVRDVPVPASGVIIDAAPVAQPRTTFFVMSSGIAIK